MSKQVHTLDNVELASKSSSERSANYNYCKAKSNLSPSMSRKHKALLLVAGVVAALVLGLLIALAVGVSVVFRHSGQHSTGDPMIDDETQMRLLRQVSRIAMFINMSSSYYIVIVVHARINCTMI